MRVTLRTMLVVSLFAAPAATHAQPVDPSGHWDGVITLPTGEIAFHVDLAMNVTGGLKGTYSRPDNSLRGLPLTRVTLDGRAIGFVLTGDTTFQGVLHDDGKTISGDVTAPIGTAPFSMTRTGEAVFAPMPKNAPIAHDLEGTWNATLALQGERLRLVLQLANQADGTATGTIVSVDRGGLELPLGMVQKGSTLALSSSAVGGEFFAGSLNAAGDLEGSYTQGGASAPLTFQRAR